MSLLFSALRGTARPASVIGALFLICGTALAIRCKGYARWDGSSYTLECMNACAWGCTKDVGDHVPGIPADTGQEACKCSTTSEPSPCCHIVIVYPPDAPNYPIAFGDCSNDCLNEGVCATSPAGGGDQEALCLQ